MVIKDPLVYVVQVEYDPTVDYGCGVDMTTRDTLHIADNLEGAQTWLIENRSNIDQQYQDIDLFDVIIVPWEVNASWDDDKSRFAFEHD